MKRLLIGVVAVGSLLFATGGVASATTSATVQVKPAAINLDKVTCAYPTLDGQCGVSAGPEGAAGWPLAANPGSVLVKFALPGNTAAAGFDNTPTGYLVVCKPNLKDAISGALLSPAPANVTATFTDADDDYTDDGFGNITLKVGPTDIVNPNNEMDLLTCAVTASNQTGAQAGKAGVAIAPAQANTCGPDATYTNPGGANVANGLLSQLSFGNIAPIAADLKTPSTVNPLGVGKQTTTDYTSVILDGTALGLPSALPFCSTSSAYKTHILNSQQTTVSAATAVVAANATKHTPSYVKFTGVGIVSPIRSTSTLIVEPADLGATPAVPGATVVYSYDSSVVRPTNTTAYASGGDGIAAAGCNGTGIVCLDTATVTAAQPSLPTVDAATGHNIGYVGIMQLAGQTITPGVSLTSTKANLQFTRVTGNTTGQVGLKFVAASLRITLNANTLPLTVATPGLAIAQANTSFASVPASLQALWGGDGTAVCASSTTGPQVTGACYPFNTLAAAINTRFGQVYGGAGPSLSPATGVVAYGNYFSVAAPGCTSIYTGPVSASCYPAPYLGGPTNNPTSPSYAPDGSISQVVLGTTSAIWPNG